MVTALPPAADWEAALEQYAATHPEVRVYDPPAATYPLRNRGTMVSFLDGGGWLFEVSRGGGVGTARQRWPRGQQAALRRGGGCRMPRRCLADRGPVLAAGLGPAAA